jgi:hypothetical protein
MPTYFHTPRSFYVLLFWRELDNALGEFECPGVKKGGERSMRSASLHRSDDVSCSTTRENKEGSVVGLKGMRKIG